MNGIAWRYLRCVSSSLIVGSRGARPNCSWCFVFHCYARAKLGLCEGLIIIAEDPNMRSIKNSLFIVVTLLNVLCLVPIGAQESKGTISGTVKDPAGGVLVGALVELQPTGKRV